MATSKSGGSTGNGRDSAGRRLGCKCFDGEAVHPGVILVRQRGTRIHPGVGVMRGKDDTLFAVTTGKVKYCRGMRGRRYVTVVAQLAA